MFKIDELSGHLIKSGRFIEAIDVFGNELSLALNASVLGWPETFGPQGIIARFNRILLNPSNPEEVEKLGQDMLFVAIRIPGYVKRA